jgi:hypothetical protein
MTSHHFRGSLVLLGALVAGSAACASEPSQRNIKLGPVDTGPGTLTEARQYLQGQWTLVSFDIYPPNRPAIRDAASGTMVFDEFSNMKVDLRLKPESTQIAQDIGIPVSDGVVSMNGRTVVDINSRSISYVFDGQSSFRQPNHPLDMNLPRYWEVQGNTLTLRTKDDTGTVLSVSVWRKGQ